MDSGIKSVAEVDNADKQLVKSIKSLLCEIRRPFPESGVEKISYTVYLTDPRTVTVEAYDEQEAYNKVREAWIRSEYVLNADDFLEAGFEVTGVIRK